MKRKILLLTLAFAAALTMTACGNTSNKNADDLDADSSVVGETDSVGSVKSVETAEEEKTEPYIAAEWSEEAWSDLTPLITSLNNIKFIAGTADYDDVFQTVTYDDSIIKNIEYDTTGVDFNTPGDYKTVCTVHFDKDALCNWMEENDVDRTLYGGLNENVEQVYVPYTAVITITEAT